MSRRRPFDPLTYFAEIERPVFQIQLVIAFFLDDPGCNVGNQRRQQVKLMRWGLVPSWAEDPSIENRMIINESSKPVAFAVVPQGCTGFCISEATLQMQNFYSRGRRLYVCRDLL